MAPVRPTNPASKGQRAAQGFMLWGVPWVEFLAPVVASIVLLIIVLMTMGSIRYYTGGHYAYSLDDAYIHMALAKNLARHGVLGATPFEFTSASSSPLWTFLMAAAFLLFGVRDFVPLAMTITCSIGVIFVLDFVMRRLGVPTLVRAIWLVWITAVTPLIALIYGGMEHPLQILVNAGLLYAAVRVVERGAVQWDRLMWTTLVLAAATTAVRYEGMLLVALVVGLVALRRLWAPAAAIAAAGALPIVTYGLFSLANGGFFLPNSVVVKSADNLVDRLLSGGMLAYQQWFTHQFEGANPVYLPILACIVLLFLQWRSGVSVWDAKFLFPAVMVVAATIHILFGQMGWAFRYEAYLVALLRVGLMVQIVQVYELRGDRRTVTLVAAALAVVLVVAGAVAGFGRARLAWESTPRATENVYEQMYQTAHFLKENPQYSSVAIGDLGAVAYYNDDLRILDLEGLAERGVPPEKLGRFNSTAEDIAARAKADGAQIAIVFPDYFDLPKDWVPVAEWKISNNLVAYKDTVQFLAIPPTDPAELAAAVQKYSMETLPKTVGARGVQMPEQ